MRLTKKQAKELSIKKWEYIVGNDGRQDINGLIDKHPELEHLEAHCGYCEKYHDNLEKCPIFLNSCCGGRSHPWNIWSDNHTEANAQKVLDLIKES